MAKGALDGIRVLLIGNVWAGPMCSALFGDMGAEVIRLESRARIDPYRIAYSKDLQSIENGPFFQVINRDTLSVTLNMRLPRARELAKTIIKESDVLLENYAPTTLRRWGLDYPSVRQINPNIIMTSISGFGQTGPMANEPGYGPTVAAIAGLSRLVGYEDDNPIGLLPAYGDPVSGMFAFFATMTALHYRARTGRGQYVDVSQLETLVALLGEELLDYEMNGRVASCKGNTSSWMAPHGFYRCKGEDKWITIACATEEEWKALCGATGNLQWLQDQRFIDSYARTKNGKALDKAIEKWTIKHTDYEVMAILQKQGVAAVPVLTMAELFTDPHAREEEYLVHLPHPNEPASYVYNIPWKLNKTPGEITRHAPLMGEHNEYVLCELCGVTKEEFQELVEEKVIW